MQRLTGTRGPAARAGAWCIKGVSLLQLARYGGVSSLDAAVAMHRWLVRTPHNVLPPRSPRCRLCGPPQATQISPWIVTLEALEPYRLALDACTAGGRTPDDPEPLPYLKETAPYTYDIRLEVEVVPAGHAQGAVVTRSHVENL